MTEEESVIFKAAFAALDCLADEYTKWSGAWKKAAYTQMPPAQPPMLAPQDPAMAGGAPPPPVGMPPMGPAMMQGGMPPVDPNTGQPMDPSMMGGMPPVDPATGQPMDPAAAGGAPPAGGGDPATQDALNQLISGLDSLSQTSSDQQARLDQTSSRVRALEQELDELKKLLNGQSPFDDSQQSQETSPESLPLPNEQQAQQILQNS